MSLGYHSNSDIKSKVKEGVLVGNN
jgi:hypothetical protein